MAEHRHKRETRRLPRAGFVAAPVAVLVTLSAVTLGVATGDAEITRATDPQLAAGSLSQSTAGSGSLPERAEAAVTRSFDRSLLAAEGGSTVAEQYQEQLLTGVRRKSEKRAIRRADETVWASVDLNLWSGGGEGAEQLGETEVGSEMLATGRTKNDRTEVVIDGVGYWVTSAYLVADEPVPGVGGACRNGTSVPGGVSQNIVKVHAAVCASFPMLTRFGTLRGGGGDHPRGRAVDISVSGALGWRVANFVRANAGALGVSYVIFAQKIWSVERGGEGWRGMSNRGSATANHYDHVHVSTF